jgi:hypothetical protein
VVFNFVPKRRNLLLLAIVGGGVGNELIYVFLKVKAENFTVNSNIYVVLHMILWFLILSEKSKFRKLILSLTLFYSVFWLVDFLLVAKIYSFCVYSFILGAFLYLGLFIYQSFYELKNDNLTFFTDNDYVLQSAPILLFLGLSFVLGFESKVLLKTLIFGTTNLYQFISYFVNIVYYTIINVYIFKEKKSLKHV